mmetsp:Transcript_29891/g.58598  ORF Transcript_29891/g.58598 Transcript_29891/m.58598 type:complete len:174 (+) Transcript_29891:36-557(+)|eukprot:CAMPEP_0175119472 /NCGR_PEP_ID=MMETSP0087-20121206/75_1 /TAXON_ID=136419 /ORGANISM="Unknown Unknown, Strain D1" /LENGTH=173 /DNA_ID=CAMNT_0016400793 /DNA_START=36 /DNA_END=557 /DNA_ORIENTATION=-
MNFLPLLIIIALAWCAGAIPSDQIPISHTTKNSNGTCGIVGLPAAVLTNCTDPLKAGIPDLRGNWQGVFKNDTHWERIEQCADRVVITAPANKGLYVIHDFKHADGSVQNGCHDWAGPTLPKCVPVKVAGVFKKNCLDLKPLGVVTAVTRCLNSDGTLSFDWLNKKFVLKRVP